MNEKKNFTQNEVEAMKGYITLAINSLNNENAKNNNKLFMDEANTEILLKAIDKELKNYSLIDAKNLFLEWL